MARPTAFTRQTSFTQFSSNFPSKQQNGASLDAEFNAAKVALDETQSNLALIQDDDGALARGSVGRGQLDSSLTVGFSSPTPWAADTAYEADTSTVWYTGKFYTAVEDHTSTETFDSTKWFEVADLSASAAIEDGSITEAKLASSAVTADKIGALAVTTTKIASQAVTNSKLANGAVTRAKVDDSAGPDLAALILPAGLGPIPWPSDTAPTGWVFDGATYLRADYPALSAFALAEAALGNVWFTVGDGSTTFGIKNAEGLALVGKDADGSTVGSALALGATIGAKEVTLTEAQIAQHDHAATTANSASTFALQLNGSQTTIDRTATSSINTGAFGPAFTAVGDTQTPSVTIPAAALTLSTTVQNAGSSDPHPNVQPSIGVRFIFKAH